MFVCVRFCHLLIDLTEVAILKFDRNRLIHGLDNGDTAIFKMAAVRHLEFAEIAVLVT